ncbi:MAG: carboxypeptidase-like regulatory domain-containing protein [Crocinitomicaceae bacterium]|nr:carboxypeptidase-like regulatory domain-containing protein [Crocinitomicaceae bacterium]
MKKLKNLFLVLFISGSSFGQNADLSYSIRAIVIDSLSAKPIPFASLYVEGSSNGTISNYQGEVELEGVHKEDVLICSYTGYDKKSIAAKFAIHADTIYLTRSAQLIDEVMVLADDAFLYDLILESKKTQSTKPRTSKTYFELETFEGEQQLELFQAYYNGSYSGYEVNGLALKNGRCALSPTTKRVFISIATSKVMYMHKLFQESDYFPTNPMELKRRKLFKYYQLRLSSKYIDNNSRTIYKILCVPKIDDGKYFETAVWIDSASSQLLKVSLKINDAQRHPFELWAGNHDPDDVDIEITKTYLELEGKMYVQSIDFDYSFTHISQFDSTYNMNTRAILYAYDYTNEFDLPLFRETKDHYNSDYHRIQMIPYHNAFWKCTNEFKIKNDAVHENTFLADSSTFSSTDLRGRYGLGGDDRQLLTPFKTWSKNRIRLRNTREETTFSTAPTIAARQYNLKALLYLDINELCDSLQFTSATVFDTYESYYHLPINNQSLAFINLYFDLMEIQRRKLDMKLNACKNLQEMKAAYQEILAASNVLTEKYIKEVQRGTNWASFVEWNALVVNELGIDNISFFGLSNEEE